MNIEKNKSYYELMGVVSTATVDQIKKAYHELARKLHPDKASTQEEREQFEEEFALISRAYNTLKDRAKRDLYKKSLEREKEQVKKPFERPLTTSTTKVKAPTEEKASIAQKSFLKGLQFFNNKEYLKAIEFFEVAIKNNEAEAEYLIKMAQALMCARKSFTKSVEYCHKAIDLDPYNIKYKLSLADLYEQAGSHTLAKNVYEDILRWDSTNPVAQARLSEVAPASGGAFLKKILSFIRKR